MKNDVYPFESVFYIQFHSSSYLFHLGSCCTPYYYLVLLYLQILIPLSLYWLLGKSDLLFLWFYQNQVIFLVLLCKLPCKQNLQNLNKDLAHYTLSRIFYELISAKFQRHLAQHTPTGKFCFSIFLVAQTIYVMNRIIQHQLKLSCFLKVKRISVL